MLRILWIDRRGGRPSKIKARIGYCMSNPTGCAVVAYYVHKIEVWNYSLHLPTYIP